MQNQSGSMYTRSSAQRTASPSHTSIGPGIAVGGHCIPVYPAFYLAGHPDAKLPAVARAINQAQPRRVVRRLAALSDGLEDSRVAVLGAAYRGGVKETAFSGVFPVVDEIRVLGGVAVVHDPMYSDAELEQLGFTPYHIGEPCDAAIVQTDHDRYRSLAPGDLPGCTAMLDGRAVLEPAVWARSSVAFAVIGTP